MTLQPWSSRRAAVFGSVVDIGSRIDPQRRTFVVRAEVDNSEDTLRPGMSFRVTADIGGELYAVVDETGVQWGADGAYVWTIDDRTARRIPIEIVQRREGRVLIDTALGPDTIVVVEGIQRMRNGVEVDYEARGFADDALSAVAIDTLWNDRRSADSNRPAGD